MIGSAATSAPPFLVISTPSLTRPAGGGPFGAEARRPAAGAPAAARVAHPHLVRALTDAGGGSHQPSGTGFRLVDGQLEEGEGAQPSSLDHGGAATHEGAQGAQPGVVGAPAEVGPEVI